MHRDWLLSLLREYGARQPSESRTVERFETFVGSHSNCFDRSCAPGHITGSAWIVSADGTRALLTHHRKLDRWLQLGGHSDGDPDTLAVALREAEEESGLRVQTLDERIFDLDVHRIPARVQEPPHHHYDVRFLFTTNHDEFRMSDESHALQWILAEEVENLTNEESVMRMARKWQLRRASNPNPEPKTDSRR